MNYDTMRLELTGKLSDLYPADMVGDILHIMDTVAGGYEISRKETALTVLGGIPEIVKLYISARAVENIKKGSLDGYRRILTQLFETVRKPFSEITANDIRLFLYKYKQDRGVTDSTIEHYRIVIHGFFEWLITEEYLTKSPARKVTPIKVRQPERHSMTQIELERLRSICKDERERAIIDFLYSTGCRVSEMCDVKISDIDWNEKTVFIRNGKGGKNRVTFLNAKAIVSLQEYIKARKDGSEYLFVSRRKDKMQKRGVEDCIKRITARKPEYFQTHITPHVFRHTAATVALHNGMPLEQVQRFLGHAKISTTLIYAELDTSTVQESHKKCVS